MALQFKPLNLPDQEIFGVSVCGSVTRGDRDRLKELADKCLEKGKTRVILDLSELGSMGGGGARMIVELQDRLVEANGSAVIAGAGDTVRRFLDQKKEKHALSYFATVDDAVAGLGGLVSVDEGQTVALAVDEEHAAEDPTEEEALATLDEDQDEVNQEVGAVSLMDEDHGAELDSLLDEFKVAETSVGRRKDHHFTSLEEALDLLHNWSDRNSQMDFHQGLKNLLFSQGLAEDVTLLVAKGGLLISPDGYKEIPLDGSLANQAEEMARPLTMLDVLGDDLEEEELSLLEAVDPDLIMPVLRQGVLSMLIMVKKGGEDREYSLAETFAFELMQHLLEGNEDARTASARAAHDQLVAQQLPAKEQGVPLSTDLAGHMLHMAVDLPEADDLPHFWRLFARHLQGEMQLEEMAYLGAGQNHPQIMLGGDDSLLHLDCSDERLQKYFQGMERPVHVANLPATFSSIKTQLKGNRINWVIGLHWGKVYQGTLFVNGDTGLKDQFPDGLVAAFDLASRLLARFEDQNDDADIFLDLIYRIMSQREKRFFGSDDLTSALVEQLNILAREMGFPPDQKRDLVYGCLLRDVGLIDKEDSLMGSPAEMTPAQWKAYRNHPTEGAALLADLRLSQTSLEVVKCHHERFNGEGFPAGLSGRDIPLVARVVTVVENYVSMITGAGGMEPKPAIEAAAVLKENLGERYDPDIVGIFLSVVKTS
jgi:anti-anti-sigma regulatory factor